MQIAGDRPFQVKRDHKSKKLLKSQISIISYYNIKLAEKENVTSGAKKGISSVQGEGLHVDGKKSNLCKINYDEIYDWDAEAEDLLQWTNGL